MQLFAVSCEFMCSVLNVQISMDTQSLTDRLRSSGLLASQGLIGEKWSDAHDGKTYKVEEKKSPIFLFICISMITGSVHIQKAS